MSGSIGLGLGIGSLDIPSSSSITVNPIPSSIPDVQSKPTHPAYHIPIPERSHRGPRSLGVGKRFVSSPSKTLPATIYDKSISNPLSVPPTSSSTSNSNMNKEIDMNFPINSPQLGLDLVNINPTQHLRQLKKRSLSNKFGGGNKRDFGLSSNDPLNRINPGVASSINMIPSSSNSPTIASSPTLNSNPNFESPIISSTSSPIIQQQQQQSHHVDMLGPSIALSVVLSLIVLGVASWVGVHYRRKRLNNQDFQEGEDEYNEEGNYGGDGGRRRRVRDSDEKSFSSEMFNASNVVEKGLKPKSSKNDNTYNDTNGELRSSFISYKRPLSAIQPSSGNGGRRVSFVDNVHGNNDNEYDYDRGMYHVAEGSTGRNRRESSLPPPRFMIASIHQPEIESQEYDHELEEEENVEEEDELEYPTPSPRSSIAPTLEMIQEEAEEDEQHVSNSQIDQTELQLEDVAEGKDRRHSMMSSTSSSSESSTCSGDYTTASARSSISSISALSIISSSFPQTPRDQSTPPPNQVQVEDQTPSSSRVNSNLGVTESPILDETNGIYDSPTPTSKFQSRRKRAQSQGANSNFKTGLIEVQKHDLLRTAIGRTMSLQPTKEVREFIKIMTLNNQNEIENLPSHPIPKLNNSIKVEMEKVSIVEIPQGEIIEKQKEKERKVQVQDEMEDLRIAAFISSQLEEKVSKEIDNDNDSCKTKIARSTSFPSKLLQRRKSSASTSPNHHQKSSNQSRKSEIITSNNSGYLKRALKAFTGEDQIQNSVDNEEEEPIPDIPINILNSTSPNKSNMKSRSKSRSRSNSSCPPPELILKTKEKENIGQVEQEESIKLLAERQLKLEHYLTLIQSEGQAQVQYQSQSNVQTHIQDVTKHHINQDEEQEIPYTNEEEVDMEIEEEEEEYQEDIDCDSVWDPDAYAQEEVGVAFEDYYIHFEGDDEEDDQDEYNGSYYNQEQEHEEEEEEIGRNLNYRNSLYNSNGLPHIRVTSH